MLTVYHGSTCRIEEPLAGVCRPNLDFGIGFYVTDLKEQAVRWALRTAEVRHKDEAWLNVYSLDMDVCRVLPYRYLCFETYDADWLDFVVACHQGRNLWSAYDMIEGGIADDRVIRTIDLYMRGDYTREEALARLIHQEPNNQICIINQEIIDRCLCFTEAFLLPKTPAPLVVPGAADTVMQGKYRGVIELLASRLRISADKALDLFYNSDTYKCLTLRNGDLLLKSDLYILDEIIRELQDKQG